MNHLPRLFALAWLATVPCAQTDWTVISPAALPPVNSDHVLGYELTGAAVILFGGDSPSGRLDQTWRYDGVTWSQLSPATRPSARRRHAGAFDLARGRFVVFGGSDVSNPYLDDTWEWDGTTWTQIASPAAPTPRIDHWMAFDPVRQQVILFGGQDATGVRADTWALGPTGWQQLAPATTPPGRRDFNMVTDTARQRVVMYGGFAGTGIGLPLGDVWEWSGADWTSVPAIGPSARGGHAMAYDELRQRTVVFGGYNAGNLGDTWEWDGASWRLRITPNQPTARSGHAMAYDLPRNRVVLYGGYDSAFRDDTWEYQTAFPAAWSAYGAGCAGTAGTPRLANATRPWGGETFTVDVTPLPAASPLAMLLGTSNTIWGGVPLPLDLGFLGAAGCRLLAAPELTVPLANTGGSARLSVPIPNGRFAWGRMLYHQALVIDIGANAADFVTSEGGEITIGGR